MKNGKNGTLFSELLMPSGRPYLSPQRGTKRHWHTMVGTSMNFPTCCNVAVAQGTESVWLPEFMSIGLKFGCFLSIL
jgi:hypothetical protein